MYEGDTPNAERRAAALALDRDLLRELLGQEELRELIDPEALDEVEDQLQHRTEAGRAGDRDALQQTAPQHRRPDHRGGGRPRRRGLLGAVDAGEAGRASAASPRCGSRGEERCIAAEDAGLYRDALGVPPPPGLPETFLEDHPDAMRALVRRYARTHGPFPTGQLPQRYGGRPRRRPCASWSAKARWSAASSCRGGTEREWCDSDVLRRVRRASLARLRKEVEPADRTELARFLPSWQNVDAFRRAGAGPDRLREALVPLQGVALTAESLGARRAAAPARRLLAELARPALHQRRADLDRRREPRPQRRPRRPLLPRGRPPRRPAPANGKLEIPQGEVARGDPRAARRRPVVLARPGRRPRPPRPRSSTTRSGTSPGRAR